jgi:adenylate cyclase
VTGTKTIRLSDHWECLEGVIPSVGVTAARDGTPNVAYLSHVFYVDEEHVALSNQFMSKTVRNIMENPRLQVAVVNGRTGQALVLDLVFERAETSGPLFDELAVCVTAVASHFGMDKVMRLRSADIYRVLAIELQEVDPGSGASTLPAAIRPNPLFEAVSLSQALSRLDDLDAAIDLVLDRLEHAFGMRHCTIFLADSERHVLTAIASRNYSSKGTGAEIRWGEGVLGIAAEKQLTLRFSCIGRHFLYASNVKAAGHLSPAILREIPMPGLDAPQSILAVPMLAGGEVRGLIFAESESKLAFSPADGQAVSVIAAQLGALVALHESSRERDAVLSTLPAKATPSGRQGKEILVEHYAYDDSVFINHDYVIKGVPGRLLWRMLQIFDAEGRHEFTNREFRLDASLKLPEFKDNLETRLLLLSRRLAENDWPVKVARTGRGRVNLAVAGRLTMRQIETV